MLMPTSYFYPPKFSKEVREMRQKAKKYKGDYHRNNIINQNTACVFLCTMISHTKHPRTYEEAVHNYISFHCSLLMATLQNLCSPRQAGL